MSTYYTQPPPMSFTSVNGGIIPSTAEEISNSNDNSPSSTSSIMIVIIVVASAVILSASIYLLLRSLSRSSSAADSVLHSSSDGRRLSGQLLESLPLFSFGSVTGNLAGIDCAVCLSRFEPHDQLRLLPLCCHAFHSECIDIWILSNQTCPLCRSNVNPTDEYVLGKVLAATNSNTTPRNGSFRLEIGSVSGRRIGSDSAAGQGSRSECSGDKESTGAPVPEEPAGESLTADVSGGRSWLRDYVDRIASFRSSGRFFSGSSRRSDVVVPVNDMEAGQIGEDISQYFSWLSAV